MLSAYLRSEETIDVSLEKRMAGAEQDNPVNLRTASESTRRDLGWSSTTNSLPSGTEDSTFELVLELDRFMTSWTAAKSPDAVIEMIIGKQELKCSHN